MPGLPSTVSTRLRPSFFARSIALSPMASRRSGSITSPTDTGTYRAFGIGLRQDDDDRVLGVARHPVALAEIRPHENAEPLQDLVADAVAEVFIDR
jgi:hypothetical protein